MYRLTDKRYEAAKPILERYRTLLHSKGSIPCGEFERELRQCWGIGYGEFEDIIEDLLKRPEYLYLAAYYMQFNYPTGPKSQFRQTLAKVYGVSYYDSPDREQKAAEFWKAIES